MCITGVCQAPQSLAKTPTAIEWLANRCSSDMMTRSHCDLSGGSISHSFSTACTYARLPVIAAT